MSPLAEFQAHLSFCNWLYYHRTTFLQLNTIRFLLPFPHPFIPSELSGFRGNEFVSMSQFLFEDILPIIRCNSMQKVLDWPFCNFVATRWTAKFKVWWYTTQNKSCLLGCNQNKDGFCVLMERRMKILVAPPFVEDHRALANFLQSLLGLIYSI